MTLLSMFLLTSLVRTSELWVDLLLLSVQRGSDNKGTQWYGGGELSFDGINIFVAKGLADNTAVAAQKSNLFFGTGLLDDRNEVKVIDMADLDVHKMFV